MDDDAWTNGCAAGVRGSEIARLRYFRRTARERFDGRMKIRIADVRDLMTETCRRAGVPAQSVDLVVDHYLLGETQGKHSHGVAKFCFESQFFGERQGPPVTVREHGALAVIDARREIGPVAADHAVRVAAERARTWGAGIVGMINTQRYGVLSPWTEQLARAGFLGIVMNTSRADSTVGGARTPFLGVNPISYAVPTGGEPLVVDMSTTESPMGVLWETRRAGGTLPGGAFVDGAGAFTTDPHEAVSAMVFGGHKGFSLSLLIQIITGSLFGFPMGAEVDSTWNTGYAFIAVDPSFGGALDDFPKGNAKLVQAMEDVATRDGLPLRIPGHRSRAHRQAVLSSGELSIDESVYRRLEARAAGDFTHE
ncbi:Ldh family oxidoreductase [Streptomyces sp. NPDC059564]|uniref:Ldh family oxidoreductase n=1 Tax=Streptomyces sp. NPDC059564 TaxID=3346865 RepID=UPI0036BBFDC7